MSSTFAAAASAAPLIDWTSLGKVAAASAAFGIGIVAVFSLGIVAIAQLGRGTLKSAGAARPGSTSTAPGRPPTANLAVAGVCFALCIAAVGYGLWIIVPQFHR